MQRTTTGYEDFWYSSEKLCKKDHLLFVIHKIIINTEIFVGIEVLNTFALQTQISYLNSNKPTFEKPEDFIQKLFKRHFLKNCLQIYN